MDLLLPAAHTYSSKALRCKWYPCSSAAAAPVVCGAVLAWSQVIAIESCLKSSAVARPDLAGLLRQVQELERDKLRLTLSW